MPGCSTRQPESPLHQPPEPRQALQEINSVDKETRDLWRDVPAKIGEFLVNSLEGHFDGSVCVSCRVRLASRRVGVCRF